MEDEDLEGLGIQSESEPIKARNVMECQRTQKQSHKQLESDWRKIKVQHGRDVV